MRFFRKSIIFGLIVAAAILLIALYGTFSFLRPEIPVLNYHQVNNNAYNALTLNAKEFDAQMSYLYKAGYNTISPGQLLGYLRNGEELPPNPILITFDDGYADNYRVAYPILKKYNFSATIFLITDFVDANPRYLTWKQIREMRANGFSFGSHTLSHAFLTEVADEELLAQLVKSREAIEWRLGEKVEFLAYPGGKYDQRVINFTKKAGYKAAFTINFGRDQMNCELFTLKRIPVFEGSHTFFRFWLRLKFTQLIGKLQSIKVFLADNGVAGVARFIYIP